MVPRDEFDGSEAAVLRTFREAVQNTGHSIYWTDTTGTIEYVNPAFEAQTGYSAEEAVGSNANILQSGVHDDRFYERLWDTILAGEVWEGEIINERKDGERYVVKQTISPIVDESGDIARFVAANEDITDIRDYQEQVERQRNRFAALFDAVPVSLVLADLDHADPVVKQTNRQFRAEFGFDEVEVGGSSLDRLIVGDDESEQAREINDRVRRGEHVREEVTRRTADGESRTFLLNATALDSAGRSEVLATYIDITDRKRAEEELRRKTEELEDFANVVSHDLRNPLNVAMGHLEIIEDEHDSPHIEKIRTAQTRMQELIENILMLARQGKTVDDMEPVALDACVRRSWETIETADATLRVESSRTVRADANRLGQLFGNLIRNAVEHGGEDVTITVGVSEDGFYVADDGPGVPESERPHVFEAGHTSTNAGTGFGLSIVREIAEAHGWDVDVTESDDGGARFDVTGVQFHESAVLE